VCYDYINEYLKAFIPLTYIHALGRLGRGTFDYSMGSRFYRILVSFMPPTLGTLLVDCRNNAPSGPGFLFLNA